MPVTTKAQLSAETEHGTNGVKRRMSEFLRKTEKPSKTRDIPNGSRSPTCGAIFLVSYPLIKAGQLIYSIRV